VAIIIGVLLTSNQLRAYLPWSKLPEKITTLPKEAAPQSTPVSEPEAPIEQAQIPQAPKPLSPVAENTPQSAAPTVAENNAASVTSAPANAPASAPANTPASAETSSAGLDMTVPKTTVSEITAAQTKAVEPTVVETPVAKMTAAETTATKMAVARIPQKAPEQPQPAEKTYSHLLGKITVQRNDSLSRIIQRVYGSFNSKYFRSLILANPLIDDPDRLDVGQIIALPAIPATVRPRNQSMWWIQIGEKDTLDAAFSFLRSYPQQAPAVRMIPYWTSESGTKFALVLKGLYATENAASLRLRHLPPEVSTEGKIISLWNESAVFFADPFLMGKKR
jgi:hypothetical protein